MVIKWDINSWACEVLVLNNVEFVFHQQMLARTRVKFEKTFVQSVIF